MFGSDAEMNQEYTKDVLSMLSGEEYSYYDSSYSDTGIRRDSVEYVADADGNIAYTNVWNYESREYNDAALVEKYKQITEICFALCICFQTLLCICCIVIFHKSRI